MDNATPGRQTPGKVSGKVWLLYFPMAALYAGLYLDAPRSAPLGDWIGWTIIALGLLAPPFILGFITGAGWMGAHFHIRVD